MLQEFQFQESKEENNTMGDVSDAMLNICKRRPMRVLRCEIADMYVYVQERKKKEKGE